MITKEQFENHYIEGNWDDLSHFYDDYGLIIELLQKCSEMLNKIPNQQGSYKLAAELDKHLKDM